MLNVPTLTRRREILSRIRSLLILTVLSVFIFNGGVFLISFKRFYINQVLQSRQQIAKQVSTMFELIIKDMKGALGQIGQDKAFLDLIENYEDSFDCKMDLDSKVNEIVVFNKYIDSVYLYMRETGQIFTTSRGLYQSDEPFTDRDIIERKGIRDIFHSEPREVTISGQKSVVFSIGAHLPLYKEEKDALLLINLDMPKMAQDLLERSEEFPRTDLSIITSRGHKLSTEDFRQFEVDSIPPGEIARLENRIIDGKKAKVIQVTWHSEELDWYFTLESHISPYAYLLSHIHVYLIVSLLFLAVFLSLVVIFYGKYAATLAKALKTINNSVFRDYVADHLITSRDFGILRKSGFIINSRGNYMFALFSLNGEIPELREKTAALAIPNIQIELISLKDSSFSVLFYQKRRLPEEIFKEKITTALMSLVPAVRGKGFIGMGDVRNHFDEMPDSFKEAVKMTGYRLALGRETLIPHRTIDTDQPFSYPRTLEAGIMKAMTEGESEELSRCLEEFWDTLMRDDSPLSDESIVSQIFRLQNSLLKSLRESGLYPAVSLDISLECLKGSDYLKEQLFRYADQLCHECCSINRSSSDKLIEKFLTAINRRYMDQDFNLNALSAETDFSRSYIGRILREQTGKNFNQILNGKRIEKAKALLEEGRLIDEAASLSGFSYTSYFIRIFKELEGETPGQYQGRFVTNGDNRAGK